MDNKESVTKLVSSDCESQLLTEEQLKFYWDNGYLVVKKLFGMPFLNLLRIRFVEIANMPDASLHFSMVKDRKLRERHTNPEMYINKVQELLYDPVFSRYTEHPMLLQILTQFIGSQMTAINSMLINKPPGTKPHPSHQDLYYFPFRPADKIIGVWTAVDPANRDNGCLYVVPGSHKVQTLYLQGSKPAEAMPLYFGILKDDIVAPMENRIHLEMDPGDTVFLHPYLVHGSGPNTSKSFRKSMTAHFASSNCHYIDVRGTASEAFSTIVEEEIRRRGHDVNYADFCRIKCKPVKGARSNL